MSTHPNELNYVQFPAGNLKCSFQFVGSLHMAYGGIVIMRVMSADWCSCTCSRSCLHGVLVSHTRR